MIPAERKALVLGAGDIGRRVFHQLSQSPNPRHVQLVGRDEDAVLKESNLARYCGLQRGLSPHVSHAVTDLVDVARTAQVINRFDPDVVFLAASYQSWWVITTLPPDAFQRLYAANYGPWLPMHLAPVMKAMEAVKLAGTDALIVNAAYPDAVHPALQAINLSPDLGIGNVANNVPGVRAVVADELGCDVGAVEVRLVAHHYVSHRLSRKGDSGSAAMAMAILVKGEEVTDQLEVEALLRRLPGTYRRTGGMPGQAMTAASALSVVEPLLDLSSALVHVPGPHGLVGGYPGEICRGTFAFRLPPGLSLEQAESVNTSGQSHDGIADIGADGTVEFEDEAMGVLTDALGYHVKRMALSEVESCAEELAARFQAYRDHVGRGPEKQRG